MKKLYYIIFFAALVAVFFVVLSNAAPSYFHPKLKPISTVQPFSFKDQDGKLITNKDVDGKVNVVSFFFTTCTSVCPRMNHNLIPVYEAFKNEPNFLMLSYTCDPQRDSVAKLKRYADSMHVDENKWLFLTGQKDSLYAMARHSYMIDDQRTGVSTETDFLHTQLVALVNKNGEVVKIYDGLKPSELEQMKGEIAGLLKD